MLTQLLDKWRPVIGAAEAAGIALLASEKASKAAENAQQFAEDLEKEYTETSPDRAVIEASRNATDDAKRLANQALVASSKAERLIDALSQKPLDKSKKGKP